MITLICKSCGAEYDVKPYRKETSKYCSKSCHGRDVIAGKYFDPTSLVGNTYRKGMTSPMKGKVHPSKDKRFVKYKKHICHYCGNEFERVPWLDKQSSGSKYGKFCNQKCRNKFISEKKSGESSHLYVGGVKTYRGRGWIEQRKKAVDRDKGVCKCCGKHVGKSIPVHHIIPFREFKSVKEANRIDNLVCLCQSCHMKQEWSYLKNQKPAEKDTF